MSKDPANEPSRFGLTFQSVISINIPIGHKGPVHGYLGNSFDVRGEEASQGSLSFWEITIVVRNRYYTCEMESINPPNCGVTYIPKKYYSAKFVIIPVKNPTGTSFSINLSCSPSTQ